jgi:hypothetical protein
MDKLRDPKQTLARSANPEKVGWRINEWADAVGLCRASVYNLLDDQKIAAVKSGSARIITTSPREYLTSLAGKAV